MKIKPFISVIIVCLCEKDLTVEQFGILCVSGRYYSCDHFINKVNAENYISVRGPVSFHVTTSDFITAGCIHCHLNEGRVSIRKRLVIAVTLNRSWTILIEGLENDFTHKIGCPETSISSLLPFFEPPASSLLLKASTHHSIPSRVRSQGTR